MDLLEQATDHDIFKAPPFGGQDPNADFRDQYIHMLMTIRSLDGRRWIEYQTTQEEWSCFAEGNGLIPGVRLEMDSNIITEPFSRVLSVELPAL